MCKSWPFLGPELEHGQQPDFSSADRRPRRPGFQQLLRLYPELGKDDYVGIQIKVTILVLSLFEEAFLIPLRDVVSVSRLRHVSQLPADGVAAEQVAPDCQNHPIKLYFPPGGLGGGGEVGFPPFGLGRGSACRLGALGAGPCVGVPRCSNCAGGGTCSRS